MPLPPLYIQFFKIMMKVLKDDPIRTVLTISVGFLILFIITKSDWTLMVSVVIGLSGLLSDFLAMKIYWIWNKLAFILSLIIPKIILSIIFFLFLFPISFLSKIFRKKDFMLLEDPDETTFMTVDKSFIKESFEKPW